MNETRVARGERAWLEAEPLQDAAAEAKGAKTLVVTGDVSKSADVAKVFADTVAAFGRVDVVFNNAGIFPP